MRGLLLAALFLSASAAGCLFQGQEDDEDEDPLPPVDPPTVDEIFDSLIWRDHPPAPTPRTEVAATLYGAQVWVIGGFGEDGSAVGTVERFDPTHNSWTQGPALPIPVHHTGAIVWNERVYVLGGYTTDRFVPTNLGFFWNPVTESWNTTAPLPRARGAHATLLVDGFAYLVGGVGVDGQAVAPVDVYNPTSNLWTTVTDLPTPREHAAAAVVNQTVYVIGGRNGGFATNTDLVEAYDPASQTWTTPAPMPTPRGGLSAIEYRGRIVVVGGEGQDGTFGQTEVFDPATGTWTSLLEMPEPRHGLGTVVSRGRVYTMLGGPEPGLTVSGTVQSLGP